MSIAVTADSVSAEQSFKEFHPVSFRILNDKFEEKLYLENTPVSGLLEVLNSSEGDLFFIPSGDDHSIAGPENYHLAMKFRPGILRSTAKSLIKNKMIKKGWALSIGLVSLETGEIVKHDSRTPISKGMEETTATVLYFLNTTRGSLAKNQSLILPLKHLRLQCDEGTQRTQVELRCNHLATDKELTMPLQGHIRHFNLTIINHRGNPHMPLHVGFTGFNTILNDGSSPNTLTLRITNLQKKTPEQRGEFIFNYRKRSKIYLYFDTDAETSDAALGPVNEVSEIDIDIKNPIQENGSNLKHEPMFQGDKPIWEIYPDYGNVVLQPHLTKAPPYHLLKSVQPGTIRQIYKGNNAENDFLVEFESELKLQVDRILFNMDVLEYDLYLLGMMIFMLNEIKEDLFNAKKADFPTGAKLQKRKEMIRIVEKERNDLKNEIVKLKSEGNDHGFNFEKKRLQFRKVSKILKLLKFDLRFVQIAPNPNDTENIQLVQFLVGKIAKPPYKSVVVGNPMEWNNLDGLGPRLEKLTSEMEDFRDKVENRFKALREKALKLESSANYYEHDLFAKNDYQGIHWLLDIPTSERRLIPKNDELLTDSPNWIRAVLSETESFWESAEASIKPQWLVTLLQEAEYVEANQPLARLGRIALPPTDPNFYELPDDSCFDILLSDILTNYLMGTTHLYLRFENIPGYWDHTYAIPIVKQPMIFYDRYELNINIPGNGTDNSMLSKVNAVLAQFAYPAIAPGGSMNIPNITIDLAKRLRYALVEAGAAVSMEVSAEYVGIGTTKPTNKLSVEGNADFSGNVGIGNPHPLNNLSVIGDSEFIGRVGIGVNDPSQPEEIQTAAGGLQFANRLTNPINGDDKGHSIGTLYSVEATTDHGKGALIYERTASYGRGKFHFLQNKLADATNPTLSQSAFSIDNDGNVGIGTPSPDEKLEVNGDIFCSGQNIWLRGNGNAAPIRLRLHHNDLSAYIDWHKGDLNIRSNTTTKLKIKENGDVFFDGFSISTTDNNGKWKNIAFGQHGTILTFIGIGRQREQDYLINFSVTYSRTAGITKIYDAYDNADANDKTKRWRIGSLGEDTIGLRRAHGDEYYFSIGSTISIQYDGRQVDNAVQGRFQSLAF